jgi:hypothetical protein
MKYSLEEIKEMLLEPSFDLRRYTGIDKIEKFIDTTREAIKHHEQLGNDNNAEHQ